MRFARGFERECLLNTDRQSCAHIKVAVSFAEERSVNHVPRHLVILLGLTWLGQTSTAQTVEEQHVQIHGFATQAFLCSNANNYLGTNSVGGTLAWTEAAINLNDQVTTKLRAGIQLHYTRLGNFGGEAPTVDWALGDYRATEWLGIRAGKVKMRWGLYNDVQDYDPGYMWSLLPEGMYGIDTRSTNLSQLGVEVYGRIPLQQNLGSMEYSFYYGNYTDATDDGAMEALREEGFNLVGPPGGRVTGFDLKWHTPLTGLNVGGSLMKYDATATLTNGRYIQPPAFWPAYYVEYDRKKVFFSAQFVHEVEYDESVLQNAAPAVSQWDYSTWFVMGGYHITHKLQAGAYYTSYIVGDVDQSNSANYFHDWVASSRYDFNEYVYAKVEGHFIDGNSVGFYQFDNLAGLTPRTNLLVSKIGFTF